jgi:hypothetical protein
MPQSHVKQWSSVFTFWRSKEKIESVAADVARQFRQVLSQRIGNKLGNMSSEQMRGYVRAYANCLLETNIEARIEDEHLTVSQAAQIRSLSKEYLIEMVVNDLQLSAAFLSGMAAAA